jgi:hypothetical protein
VVSVEVVESKDIDIAPIYMRAGDTLHVSHSADGGPSKELIEHKMEESMTVNRISIIKIKDELGFKTAIGAILGERS